MHINIILWYFGGPYRDRTGDLFHAMEARYQLRQRPRYIHDYTVIILNLLKLVDLRRFELLTSAMRMQRSSQLSYRPMLYYIIFYK